MSDGTSWRSLNAPFDEDGFALVKRDIETLFLKQYPYIQDGNSSPSFSYKTESLPVSPIDFSGGGVNGTSATVAIGSTTTGAPGSSASVTNSGDTTNAVFNFTIPAGANGANGAAGTAATIAVGTTTTGAPGSSASVTNSGSSSAAVFDFTVPAGATGATGATGPAGPGFTNGTALGDTKVWNTSGNTWDNATAGTALSVFGRSANTAGLPSTIVAATSGHVLRYNGTALAWGSVNLAGTNDVTGTLPATKGGTDNASYAVGDLLYASTTTALSKLADVATGNALISGGVGVAPSWGKVGLTTHVSGTLPIANGGTNATSAVAGAMPVTTTTTAASWSLTPTLGVTQVSTGQITFDYNGTSATPALSTTISRVIVAGNIIRIFATGITGAETVMDLNVVDLSSAMVTGIKGTTNCIKFREVDECDSTGAAKKRVYLCSAQY